jgi:GT2 family glycosyltransferase
MRISIVTPSFNKASFLEATIDSVLGQNRPDLEYGIVDGGSTDGTAAILDTYRDKLAFVVQEPDFGMYDALVKGFARTSGDIMGYLGADDLHMPWTLSIVSEVFAAFPDIEWLTSMYPLTADKEGRIVRARKLTAPAKASFFRGAYLPGFAWHSHGWIQQESTFWRRSLWERAGGLDGCLKYAGDFDLWCRFMSLAEPATVATPLAAFRRHGDQISSIHGQAYAAEALAVLERHQGKPAGRSCSRARLALERLFGTGGTVISFNPAAGAWKRQRA